MTSGKSTIADILQQDHGFTSRSFGSVVRATAAERQFPDDRDTLQRLGQELLVDLGADGFASMLLRDGARPIVIDGVRHLSVRDALVERLPGALTVYLAASADALDARWADRGDAGARSNFLEHEVEADLKDLRSEAALTIRTDVTGADTAAALLAFAAGTT